MWALWERGILSWLLWPQQLPIYLAIRNLDPSVVLAVVLCARQFGKTFLEVLMAIEDCLRYHNKSILIVGPTIKQCREIVAPKIRQISETAPPGLIRQSKSEGKWYIGTCDLILGGFDQRSSDRGKSLQDIYIEEVVDSDPDQYLQSYRSDLSPALTHSDGGRMKFFTTLPKFPDHPFITETIPEARLSGAFYSFSIDDNTKLTPAQYERCVALSGGRDSIDFRREYLNEIVRDSSIVVVPGYDDVLNVSEIPLPDRAIWQVSGDWGGVRDKTCALLHFYDYMSDLDVFWDELVFEANTPTAIITRAIYGMEQRWGLSLVALGNQNYIFQRALDCAGQIQVDLAAENFECISPAKDNWLANIRTMADRFAQRRAMIHPRCTFLRESMRSGIFNKQKTDFERTKALGHCDGIAAAMYGIRTRNTDNPYGLSYRATSYQNTIVNRQDESEFQGLARAMGQRRK